MRQKRAYRCWLSPTSQQPAVLARTFGRARYACNWALHLRIAASCARQERIGYHDTSAALTALKQQPEMAWLIEASSVPLQQTLRHLDRACHTCFQGRANYLTCKKKRGGQAATYATCVSSAFRWETQTRGLSLAKMAAPLEIHWSRPQTGTPSNVTISTDTAGRYFVSCLVEDAQSLPVVNARVGVDVGLRDLAVLSTGEKVANPKHLHQSERRLTHVQRNLVRKQRGSKYQERARPLLVTLDRWDPRAKRCAACGLPAGRGAGDSLPLEVREWMCASGRAPSAACGLTGTATHIRAVGHPHGARLWRGGTTGAGQA